MLAVFPAAAIRDTGRVVDYIDICGLYLFKILRLYQVHDAPPVDAFTKQL